MAFLIGNLHSKELRMETQVALLLPQDRCEAKEPYRVLYLLHGLGDNASSWQRYSGLELMLRRQNVVVVMPEVQRSFYCDMAWGAAYFSYITRELPDFIARTLRVSPRREDTFIAGLSMGGFGALKCGFTCPEQYGGCASFSGAVSLPFVIQLAQGSPRLENQTRAVLGDSLAVGEENDLLALAKKLSLLPPDDRPRVLTTCGLSDGLLEINREMAKALSALPLDYSYQEWEGDHNWQFWNESLAKMLGLFLNIKGECS